MGSSIWFDKGTLDARKEGSLKSRCYRRFNTVERNNTFHLFVVWQRLILKLLLMDTSKKIDNIGHHMAVQNLGLESL